MLIDAVTVANSRRLWFDLFNFVSMTNYFMLLKTVFSTEFGAKFVIMFLVFGVSRLIKSDMIARVILAKRRTFLLFIFFMKSTFLNSVL